MLFIYGNELDIHAFASLISSINENALNSSNYIEWENNIDNIIEEWKISYK
ncbi:MAG: hypothetical protein GX309_04050 [Clostridiales bacterium]|nr:hypothetical protein [Clostridiales bacterium]